MSIKTSGFYITDPGDPSVGIFEQEWELSGMMIFEDQEEMEIFKTALQLAFELITDGVEIETFEERNARIEQEDGIIDDIQYPFGDGH